MELSLLGFQQVTHMESPPQIFLHSLGGIEMELSPLGFQQVTHMESPPQIFLDSLGGIEMELPEPPPKKKSNLKMGQRPPKLWLVISHFYG